MHAGIRNSIYLLLGLLGFKATPAIAAQDMFLCAAELEGETDDLKYPGCMDVLAWSWGASNSGSTHVGGGGGTGDVSFQDISVTKFMDKASPDIMMFTANGKHFPKLELLVHKPCVECKVNDPYYRLTMENVIVTSVSTGGSGGEDKLTENVSFNFSKVEWCYTELNVDGTPAAGEECGGWDIQANQPF